MKIIIVDDDKLVSTSLKTIIETDQDISVCGVGCSGMEAVELYEKFRPDIVLMDIRMKGMTGLEAGEIILSKDNSAKIMFLTTFSDDEYIIKALKIGAKGYLLKQNFECIIPSLKALEAGQRVFGDDIVARLPSLLSDGKPVLSDYGISPKESEIIALIAQGLNNREISEQLFLSDGTVRNSISIILQKLNLRGRTQLAIFYYKNRL
jgi:DNA-binding NarL/FixJ family response regulator